MAITWRLEDHLCRTCGGRILRSVSGAGVTPGGNPIYRCANCGAGTSSLGPEAMCWCGFSHRGQNVTAYRCVSFAVLEKHPELLSAFRACGCDPERGQEVGIMLEDAYRGVRW